jgi:Trk K+ transport system NAD-binding subunit
VNDILWLTMRRMRLPLIVLLIVYFGSVFTMVSVPGADAAGNPVRMDFLHAAYFVLIMATTIGFGEVPLTFTPEQRLVVFALILPNVVAWLYSIGTILGLFLDADFREVLRRSRFARRVAWLGDPFFIVCGSGNTGGLVVRGLTRRGLGAVVLEKDPETVHGMSLEDELAHIPALATDTGDRRNLELAGLGRPNCEGVIVTTNDDHANLKIAITIKLLRPNLPVYARSETQRVSDNMKSFGTDIVINPYAIFAERLFLALSSPMKYLVQDWLISVQGTPLRSRLDPPSGRWVVCGAGRFGEHVLQRLAESSLPVTVVDVHPDRVKRYDDAVLGRGTEAHTLEEARIADAVGIIACTGDDVDNLSIIMTARELNSDLFVVARQESQANDELFNALNADLVARRSLIVARRILAIVTTPLLQTFLQHLVREDEAFAERIHTRLKSVLRDRAPNIWLIQLRGDQAIGLRAANAEGVKLKLRDITHNTRSIEAEALQCVCLVVERGAQRIFLPEDAHDLLEGDRLLFAGRGSARREMSWGLSDANALLGFASGKQLPRGAIWRWLWRRQRRH